MAKFFPRAKSFAHIIKWIWYSKGSFWKTEKYTLKQFKNTAQQLKYLLLLHENPLDIKEYLGFYYAIRWKESRILITAIFSLSVWQDTRFNLIFLLISAGKQQKNACYRKSLICFFWLHVILLYYPRNFRWGWPLHEERSNLTSSDKIKKAHKKK